jgi:hypothetical protein
MPGGRGREAWGPVGCVPVGVRAFLFWGDQPRRPGLGGKGAASLIWVRGAWCLAPAT